MSEQTQVRAEEIYAPERCVCKRDQRGFVDASTCPNRWRCYLAAVPLSPIDEQTRPQPTGEDE